MNSKVNLPAILKSVENYIRRVYAEMKNVSPSEGFTVLGTVRIVEGVMLTGDLVDELNNLEDAVYEARK